jgi:hypothetical protein
VKARKLEGLLAHFKGSGTSRFVMPLSNITSLAFDLVCAAATLDIDVRYFIVDDPPLPPEQRRSIFMPIAGNATLVGASYPAAAARLLGALIRGWPNGPRTMIAAPSPSHPTAIAGVARGYIEAMRQAQAAEGSLPRTVYVAAASGSTAAGLALGEALMRVAGAPLVEIAAVQVVPQPISLWLPWLVRWTAHYWKLGPLPRLETLAVIKDPRHTQYGRFDDRQEETCRRVADQFGISIDPIYGGKCWTILEERERARSSEWPALFWHCGYTRNWREYRIHPGTHV